MGIEECFRGALQFPFTFVPRQLACPPHLCLFQRTTPISVTEQQEVRGQREHWPVARLLGCAHLPQAQNGLGRKLAS